MDISLENEVHNRFISNTEATNRGLKYETYYVIKCTTMSAIRIYWHTRYDALCAAFLAANFDVAILLVKNTSLSHQPELKKYRNWKRC